MKHNYGSIRTMYIHRIKMSQHFQVVAIDVTRYILSQKGDHKISIFLKDIFVTLGIFSKCSHKITRFLCYHF
jgi:hypothetical protein